MLYNYCIFIGVYENRYYRADGSKIKQAQDCNFRVQESLFRTLEVSEWFKREKLATPKAAKICVNYGLGDLNNKRFVTAI